MYLLLMLLAEWINRRARRPRPMFFCPYGSGADQYNDSGACRSARHHFAVRHSDAGFRLLFEQKNFLLASCVLNVLSFAVIYLLHPVMQAHMTANDFWCVLVILVGGAYMAKMIVDRGKEVFDSLQETLVTKQELMVRNILMDKLSKMDTLTELYNHMTFHEYLDNLIEQNAQYKFPILLAVLDIDNFKRVNDEYGHRAGDSVLVRVAAVIRDKLRPNDFAARYGGEEFAIIFADCSFEEAYTVVERIRREVSAIVHEELGYQAVTLSAGLQQYEANTGKEKLFKGADSSLYAAKRSGKKQDHMRQVRRGCLKNAGLCAACAELLSNRYRQMSTIRQGG